MQHQLSAFKAMEELTPEEQTAVSGGAPLISLNSPLVIPNIPMVGNTVFSVLNLVNQIPSVFGSFLGLPLSLSLSHNNGNLNIGLNIG